MRTKAKHAAPKTREELEGLVGQIADLINHERLLKVQMDDALLEIKSRYEAHFAGVKERLAVLLPQVEAWAEAHQDEFGKQRSLTLLHGTIGWRTGNPTLKTIAGWTWDRVLEAVRTAAGNYIRSKEEVNKQAILADRVILGPEGLRALGVKVVQADDFFVEPHLADHATREAINA
jgi:phage host-nuclease inhibitor protein Gam